MFLGRDESVAQVSCLVARIYTCIGALIVHLRYLWPFISDIVGVHTHQWSHTCLLQVSPRSVLLVLASCLFRCLHACIPSLLNCITSVSLTLFACRLLRATACLRITTLTKNTWHRKCGHKLLRLSATKLGCHSFVKTDGITFGLV